MAIAGKNGKVVIGTSGGQKVVGIKNWSLELSLETLETTALGDDWKNYIAGLKEWTASSEGDYEVPTDTQGQKALQTAFLGGQTVTVKLYVDGSNYYTGDAYISSLSIEDPVDDVVSMKANQGNITTTWRGNPALQLGDTYECEDRFGDSNKLICESNKFSFDGGLKQETRGRKI